MKNLSTSEQKKPHYKSLFEQSVRGCLMLLIYFFASLSVFAQPPVHGEDCGRSVLRFDGTNHVSTTIDALSETTQGSGTWEAWVSKDNWNSYSGDNVLFSNGIPYPGETAFYISLHAGVGLHFRTGYTDGAYAASATSFGYAPGSWHHLAATWSEQAGTVTINIFLDGVSVGTTTSTSIFDLGSNYYFGSASTANKFVGGKMAEVRVWDIVRTEQEIADNRNSPLAGDEPGLVGYWPLNETSGSETTSNLVVGGVEGTLQNANSSEVWLNFPLEIKRSDEVIVNGSVHSFGTIVPEGSSGNVMFTLTNYGGIPLSFVDDPITVLSGADADQFTLDLTGTSATLAAGASTTFMISFDPTGTGTKEASVSLTNVESCTDPFVIHLSGVSDYALPPITNGDCGRNVLAFDGIGNYADVSIASFNDASGTIEAWVRKDSWIDGEDDALFSNGISHNSPNSFYLSFHPVVGMHFRYGGSETGSTASYSGLSHTNSLSANTWYHIAGTWHNDGSNTVVKTYLDGTLVSTSTTTNNLVIDAGTSFGIGKGAAGSHAVLRKGAIAEFRVWDIAKSESDIAENRSVSMTGEEANLIGYWPLDDAAGSSTAANLVPAAEAASLTGFSNLSGAWVNYPLIVEQGGNTFTMEHTYDFGTIFTGQNSSEITFAIKNNGLGILNLVGSPIATISGADADQFTLNLAGTSSTLAIDGTTTFAVSFTPSTAGVKEAYIELFNEDGCSDPYVVNFSGISSILAASITVDSHVLINGGSSGELTAVATEGTSPYSYLWSTGATTATVSNLSAGDYTVTVTDLVGATVQASASITQPDELIASIEIGSNATTIGGADGQLTASATGGVEPYTYLWNNSETTASISDLTAGDYEVTVTDANGATASETATITQPLPFEAGIHVVTEMSSSGAYGELSAYGRYGLAPYTYLWSTGATTQTISGLSYGTYTVTITDDEGQEDEATIELVQNASITYTGGFYEAEENNGSVFGSAKIKLSGAQFNSDDDFLDESEVSLTLPEGLEATIEISQRNSIMQDWSSYKLPELFENQSWSVLTFGNGGFVSLTSSNTIGAMYSEDGLNWEEGDIEHQNWSAAVYGAGKYVAISTDGTASVSTNGINWSSPSSFQDAYWRDMAFGNGLFVAIAQNFDTYSVMVSEDGEIWEAPDSFENQGWRSITYGGGQFTVVSEYGDIMISEDGQDWDYYEEAIESSDITDIAYGNGIFVICSDESNDDFYGKIWTSTDGINWSEQTIPVSREWDQVTYAGGRFIAIGESYDYDGEYVVSDDGVNWTSYDNGVYSVKAMSFGNGIFLEFGDNDNISHEVFITTGRSTALLTLTGNATNHLNSDDIDDIVFNFTDEAFANTAASDVTNAVNASSGIGIDFIKDPAIVYSGNGFAETIDNDGEVSGSILITLTGENFSDDDEDGELEIDDQVMVGNIPDGLEATFEIVSHYTQGEDWEDATDESISDTWSISAYGNGAYVAIDDYDFIYSTDGETWTEGELDNSGWNDITFGNDLFVAVGDYGYIMTSSDGINWNFQEVDGSWYGIAYGDGLFVAVGDDETMTSSDGINWTVYEDDSYTEWHAVAYGNGVFVAVSTNDEYIMFSADGEDWSLVDGFGEEFSGGFEDIAFGNGVFVAMNEYDFVYVSDDGENWDSYSIDYGYWNSITFGGGQFIIIGDEYNSEDPVILRSNDGENWLGVESATGIDLNDILYADGSFYIFTDDYEHWLIKSVESSSEAQLVLSGNATAHQAINDISDITFEFNNNAFVNIEADDVLYATGPASSGLGIDFDDNINDTCESATELTVYAKGEGDYTEGSTEFARIFEGSLDCAEDGTVNDIWYKFTIGSTGAVEINATLGTAGYVSGAVYTSCGGEYLYCATDMSQKIYLPLAPNVDVYLQLWNSVEDEGTFSVRINEAPNTWTFSGWSAGEVPGATDDALILSTYSTSDEGSLEVNNLELIYDGFFYGGFLNIENDDRVVVNGDLTNNGGLFVESGGSLLTFGDVSTVDFSEDDEGFVGIAIGRNTTFDYTTGRYSIVGSPVQEANFSNLGSNALIYAYDESAPYNLSGNAGSDRFKIPTQLELLGMEPGVGYFSAFTGDEDGTVYFIGTPNHGLVEVPLSYTDQEPASEEPFEGFNLVSNPYPAALSFTTFIDENSGVDMEETIYLWDDYGSDTERGSDADYLMVNASLGTTNSRADGEEKWDGYIRSGQGFFVKANSAEQTLQFTDVMKATSNNSDGGFFRKEPVTRYKLALSDGISRKATIVGYVSDATLGKDKAYDAVTFAGGDLQIYSLQAEGNVKLGIQGLPASYDGDVQLGFKSAGTSLHAISLMNVEELGQSVWLYDSYLDQTYDLTTGTYTFSTAAGEFNDRFLLRTARPLALKDQKANVYAFHKVLHIEMPTAQPVQYQIYNLSGVSLKKAWVNGSTQIDLSHLRNGVYIVSDGTESKKIILK
jgi:hypothetical protein